MNSLILSTGSNLGDKAEFLNLAKNKLEEKFQLVEESRIYESAAVDYLNQPDFLNQVLHFQTELTSPEEVLSLTMGIEKTLGRKRDIDKGPRTVDIDILFWNQETISLPHLEVPHPRLFSRSFIVQPLFELKVSEKLKESFNFPDKFDNTCWVFSDKD